MDTSSLIVLGNFYPDRFRGFWEDFDALAASDDITSVSEVKKEVNTRVAKEHLVKWVRANSALFTTPTAQEMQFVGTIFAVPRFQALVKKRNLLQGSPVADPFVIARAACGAGCVVTEETVRGNAVRIPTVCAHFNVDCTNLEGLMARQGWKY